MIKIANKIMLTRHNDDRSIKWGIIRFIEDTKVIPIYLELTICIEKEELGVPQHRLTPLISLEDVIRFIKLDNIRFFIDPL